MKRKPHTVNFDDLQAWFNSEEVLYAASSYERKRLVYTLTGNFIVRTPEVIYYEGKQMATAVIVYNQITAKYIDPKINWEL